MTTVSSISEESLRSLVANILFRGSVITVVGAGLVRVTGEVSITELQTLQANAQRVAAILAAADRADQAAMGDVNIKDKIESWRASCTPDKGYDWKVENWLTEYWEDELLDAVAKFEEGKATLDAVHKAFVKYADAHKRSTFVLWNGRRRQTVTPQIQPKSQDFARALRLFGIPIREYADVLQGK